METKTSLPERMVDRLCMGCLCVPSLCCCMLPDLQSFFILFLPTMVEPDNEPDKENMAHRGTYYSHSSCAEEFAAKCNEMDERDPNQDFKYSKEKISKKKKDGKKQMTIKMGLKNMVEKNFQGVPVDRCTVIPELDVVVFIPKHYGALTRARYRRIKCDPPADAIGFCGHCYLAPCSAEEFQDELDKTCIYAGTLCESVEELDLKLRNTYLGLMHKKFPKYFMKKNMPNKDAIPHCVVSYITKLVEVELMDGHDSLAEPVELASKKKNKDIEDLAVLSPLIMPPPSKKHKPANYVGGLKECSDADSDCSSDSVGGDCSLSGYEEYQFT